MTNKQGEHLVALLMQIGQRTPMSPPSNELFKFLARNPETINSTVVVETISSSAQSLLHRSAFLGNKLLVAWLLLRGANINVLDSDDQTPLDYAESKMEEDVASFLKTKGAKSGLLISQEQAYITTNENNKMTLTAESNKTSMQNFPVIPNTINLSEIQAGIISQESPRGDLINLIHKYPEAINSPIFANNRTFLHVAALAGKSQIVQWLIMKGADLNVVDDNGWNPYDLAKAKNNNTHVVDYLRGLISVANNSNSPVDFVIKSDAISRPINDYLDHGDGTVTDTITGLIWMRCSAGQSWDGRTCGGRIQTYTWDQAVKLHCGEYANDGNWRLPTIEELKSLVDYSRTFPAIDPIIFPNTAGALYWSNSTAAIPDKVYGVGFGHGIVRDEARKELGYVRFVRTNTKNNSTVVDDHGKKDVIAQVEENNSTSTRINRNYIDNKDGTVTDTRTNLIWMRCALGQVWDGSTCVGDAAGYEWNEVKDRKHQYAGHVDWYVPTIYELKGILESTPTSPRIDIEAFPCTPGAYFWSSTIAPRSDHAWGADFGRGGSITGSHGFRNHVRLVRKGNSTTTVSVTNKTVQPVTTAIGSYLDNGDGTVTDTRTGLTWMRCAIGQKWNGSTCVGKAETYSWHGTMATQYTYAGHADWRIPDLDELLSIVDPTRGEPAIDITVFPNASNHLVWSGTPANSGNAHYVSFLGGTSYISSRLSSNCVRYVRGGYQQNATLVEDNNGTVTDPHTGLTWMRCPLGQVWNGTSCVGTLNTYTWDMAMAIRQNFAGHTDWNLPELAEIQSIIGSSSGTSARIISVFNKIPNVFFWTSTQGPDGRVGINFGSGITGFGGNVAEGAVLLVRGKQIFEFTKVAAVEAHKDKCAQNKATKHSFLVEVGIHDLNTQAANTQHQSDSDAQTNETMACSETAKAVATLDKNPPMSAPVYINAAYIDNQDGTVTDTRTDLTWMRCALGQIWDGSTCVGDAAGYEWNEVKDGTHHYAGHVDWYVPTIYELKSILDSTLTSPSIDQEAFPCTPGAYFWSSSAVPGSVTSAWGTYFDRGVSAARFHLLRNHVRLVRKDKPNPTISVADKTVQSVTTAIGSYLDNGDGTVTDTCTGLTWMRCAIGQKWDGASCVGSLSTYTWAMAMTIRQNFAGHNDWHLPELAELQSIIASSSGTSARNTSIFNNIPNVFFWTSNQGPDGPIGINFGSGLTGLGGNIAEGAVLLVRGKRIWELIESSTVALEVEKTIPPQGRQDNTSSQTPSPTEQSTNSDLTPAAAIATEHVTEVLQRLDFMEGQFTSAINRVESAFASIPAGQLEIYNALQKLHPLPSTEANQGFTESVELRALIERQEIRFDASINRIEMILKSLLESQAALTATIDSVRHIAADNTKTISTEIAGLRGFIASALTNAPPTSSISPPQPIHSEPELIELDSMANISAWLLENDFITLAELRIRLLPLDLLPNAVIDDINQRALDLTDEPALIEDGDTVVVQREVLLQVITS